MDDLLSEGEQWEALKGWVRRNGVALVAGLAIGALLLGGWRWWQQRLERLALEASAKYEAVLAAFDKPDIDGAMKLVDELKRDYGSSGYVVPAELAAARAMVASDSLDRAAERLRSAASLSKAPQMKLVVLLRLARVQIAQGKPDEALATLGSAGDAGAFASRYAEARGDALLAKGDRAGALREYLTARAAPVAAPPGVAASELLDLKINDLQTQGAK